MAKLSLKEQIKRTIRRNFPNKKEWEDITTYTITNIKASTRKGIQISTGKAFKGLEKSSIRYRKYLEKYGNATGISYKTEKANLTVSGELIESLGSEFKKNQIKILPKGKHKQYKGKSGKIGKRVDNYDLAGWLKELGYDFIGMNDKMRKVIKNKIKAVLRRNLKK